MLTQSQTQNIENQLILENPNTTESYYSLCNFKERQEALAVEKLRGFDEISKSKSLYQKYFGFSAWTRPKSVGESQYEELQDGEDGISLLYKKLSLENDSFDQKRRDFLSGWEVCGAELHQKVQYLKGKSMWKESGSSTRRTEAKSESISNSSSFNPSKKESSPCKTRKSEFSEAKATKKDRNLQPSPREEIPRQSMHRAISPHNTIKFHQFSNTNDYIKYYRDNITHTTIREHFFDHVEGKTSMVRPQTFPFVKRMKSLVKRESPAKIYRLHISEKASFNILKVGPCPSLNLKTSPNKNKENDAGLFISKSLTDAEKKKGLSKDNECLMANASRLLSDQSSYSLSPKKGTRGRESYPVPTANSTDFEEVQQIRSEDGSTSASDDVKLKKVGLRVNKTLAPRLRAKRKTARFNRPKQNHQAAVANKAKQAKSNQRARSFSTSPGNTLGDKEFLHITKPKVIGVNPANQKGSNTRFNTSPPDHDALQASVALYPWVDEDGSIPRGRLIEANHIINQTLLKSRLPEKGFQACITPSTYPKSTIGVTMQVKADQKK